MDVVGGETSAENKIDSAISFLNKRVIKNEHGLNLSSNIISVVHSNKAINPFMTEAVII